MAFILGDTPPQAASGAAGDLIKDTTAQTFVADVLDASRDVPVIVDFWAPWCGPCKQLTPALEKAVTAAGGAVKLVKINVDENQEIAAQMRVQSIPAVYAFVDGRPLDGFVGAQPESQIKAFIDRLIEAGGGGAGGEAAAVEAALAQAKELLDAGQLAPATELYGQIAQAVPDNPAAVGGLVQCFIKAGQLDQARAILGQLPDALKAAPEIASALSSLELLEQANRAAGQLAELEAKITADPNDHQARFDLAQALVAHNQQAAAIDHLVEIVRRDRAWDDEAARKQLLKMFEAFGPTDPLTLEGRRKLSAVLFR